jgi:hypothetical protein
MAKKAKARSKTPRSKGRGVRASKGTAQSAYERRIAKYLATHPGATRQEARGHKRREHVERERREVLKTGLTSHQKISVRRFAEKQAQRSRADPDETKAQMLRWAGETGYDKFEALRDKVKELSKRKRARVRQRIRSGKKIIRIDVTGRSPNIDEMEDFADDIEVPFEWLFYH